jgi:hypothetical protein
MQDPLGALTRQPSTSYPPLSAVTALPVSKDVLNNYETPGEILTFLKIHKIYLPLVALKLHVPVEIKQSLHRSGEALRVPEV